MIKTRIRTQGRCYRISDEGTKFEIIDYSRRERTFSYKPVAKIHHNADERVVRKYRNAIESWFDQNHGEDFANELISGRANPLEEWRKIKNHHGLDDRFDVKN